MVDARRCTCMEENNVVDRERYRWERDGLHWVVRAGSGTRALFRCWRKRTAMRVTSILLEAYLDGHFQERMDQRLLAEHSLSDEDFALSAGDGP